MIRKRFDPELYAANDKIAKDRVRSLVDGTIYRVEESDKKTDVDLKLIVDGKHIANIECEIKRVWKGGSKFPYGSINFPERKAKYAQLDIPTYFVMFNDDQTEYLVVSSEDLLSSPLKEVPNKYVRYGEKFFQVDLNQARFGGLIEALNELGHSN